MTLNGRPHVTVQQGVAASGPSRAAAIVTKRRLFSAQLSDLNPILLLAEPQRKARHAERFNHNTPIEVSDHRDLEDAPTRPRKW